MTDRTTHSEPDAVSESRTTPSGDATDDVLTDPSSLVDRTDVDYREHTFVHGSEEHCEADFEGRAIVGVTNDAGELLLRAHRESGGVVLPNGKVEQGEDWAAAGVRGVRRQTGLDVDVEAVERVRHVEHRVEERRRRSTRRPTWSSAPHPPRPTTRPPNRTR
ncbi:NUDIX domain-containing protein [Halobacteriaceae archaeon GCM10025711]